MRRSRIWVAVLIVQVVAGIVLAAIHDTSHSQASATMLLEYRVAQVEQRLDSVDRAHWWLGGLLVASLTGVVANLLRRK